MSGTDAATDEGLRERKKRRTRREISDVATRLFAEHGFEGVTLAQIADAAEVSVKTIFNHFGSKEDLYFDRLAEARTDLVATIAERPEGTTVLRAVRRLLAENRVAFRGVGWDALAEPAVYEDFRAFLATQDRSPALRARRLTFGEELGELLRRVLATELDRDPDDPAVDALCTLVVAAMLQRDRVLRVAVAEGAPYGEVRDRVVAVVDEAFDRLDAAFADVDRPR